MEFATLTILMFGLAAMAAAFSYMEKEFKSAESRLFQEPWSTISAVSGSLDQTDKLRAELHKTFGRENVIESLGYWQGEPETSFLVFSDNVILLTALASVYNQTHILTSENLIDLTTGAKQRVLDLVVNDTIFGDCFTELPGGTKFLAILEEPVQEPICNDTVCATTWKPAKEVK
jgi:hypothetical protein